MIDERMEEQASLYVLGVLTPTEQQAFETALAKSAELQQLVAALHAACAGNRAAANRASPTGHHSIAAAYRRFRRTGQGG